MKITSTSTCFVPPSLSTSGNTFFCGNGVEESKLRGSTRPTVSDLNKLEEVNGRTIAYAAVLARFSISDACEYKHADLHFHYPTFYYAIVDWFEEFPDDEHVVETLKWWNKKIWPEGKAEHPTNKRPLPQAEVPTDSDIARSRAARRRRLAAQQGRRAGTEA